MIGVRRAFALLFKRDICDEPIAEVINVEEGRYVSYDFDDWIELSQFRKTFEPMAHDWVRTVRIDLVVPRIIRVLSFAKMPRGDVKFNRRNIYARDNNLCQYCGRKFSSSELSLDHVVPRAQGGGDSWENVVCCCVKCNVRKGGRTPTQASMKLIKKPVKPKRSPTLTLKLSDNRYASWRQFLDAAYWNVELG